MQTLFGKTFDLLAGMLDFRAARHKVIVSDIANLDTAGYRSQEIIFKEELAGATQNGQEMKLAITHKNHFPFSYREEKQYEVRQTGDKVDIDKEMTSLAENNLMYNAAAELLARKFRGLETVLREIK